MTNEEKITMVQALAGESNLSSDIISAYLNLAKDKVMLRLYPFGVPSAVTDVPQVYEMTQCELAARLVLRRGGEGEIAHSENGISRTYKSVNDEDLLERIIPYAQVIG